MKIIAIMNDNTSKAYAVLRGYESSFPYYGDWIPVDEIQEVRQYGEIGEFSDVAIKWNNFKQIVSNRNYSFIYEVSNE